MDTETQEALSNQHFGVWIVALSSGRFAVFTHPNGKLVKIAYQWEIADECHMALMRPVVVRSPPILNLELDL